MKISSNYIEIVKNYIAPTPSSVLYLNIYTGVFPTFYIVNDIPSDLNLISNYIYDYTFSETSDSLFINFYSDSTYTSPFSFIPTYNGTAAYATLNNDIFLKLGVNGTSEDESDCFLSTLDFNTTTSVQLVYARLRLDINFDIIKITNNIPIIFGNINGYVWWGKMLINKSGNDTLNYNINSFIKLQVFTGDPPSDPSYAPTGILLLEFNLINGGYISTATTIYYKNSSFLEYYVNQEVSAFASGIPGFIRLINTSVIPYVNMDIKINDAECFISKSYITLGEVFVLNELNFTLFEA